MKISLLLALVFTGMVVSLASSAQNTIRYVAIKTGLNMRDQPGVNGKVIDKIPYATKITWQENNEDTIFIRTENLNGKWRKVKYNNKTGYIVDSYLFPVPPPKAATKKVKDWLAQVTTAFGGRLVVKSGTMHNVEDGGWELHKQLYSNGAEWHEFTGYEYNSITYFIPGFTMQEAFLLLRMIPEFSDVISDKGVFPLEDTSFTKDQNSYHVKVEKELISGDYPWVKKIRIELEAGFVATFEMYEMDNQIVIFYGAGV